MEKGASYLPICRWFDCNCKSIYNYHWAHDPNYKNLLFQVTFNSHLTIALNGGVNKCFQSGIEGNIDIYAKM